LTPEQERIALAHAQQRDQAASELVRALLIVNAGGAGGASHLSPGGVEG
jgi:hypothetical protein